MNLNGRTFVVIGAGSGIGRAVAVGACLFALAFLIPGGAAAAPAPPIARLVIAAATTKEKGMSAYEKLESLAITLPGVTPPVAAFVPFVRSGNLIYISGHIAKKDGKPWTGQLGAEITTADGKEAARGIAIDLMGALQAATGNLDSIRRIVKLLVVVNSTPTFNEQHLVANGASELLAEVFGDRGKHARSAFGAAQIPFGSCVEIELIAEVADA